MIARLLKPGAEGANKAMVALLKPMAHRVKTVKTDNGGEFALHQTRDAQLGCTSYFCRPYASW